MGFEKTGRTGLGDNAQPIPPAQPVPPLTDETEEENADQTE